MLSFFWDFFEMVFCQIRTIPWMATVIRSSLTVTSRKGLMPISDWPLKLNDGPLKSSKRSVTYAALSLGESHQYGEIFGKHGDQRDVVVIWESWSCVVFFWVSSLVFCWKWRSPSRLKIWETGDFHLTSLSSILIGRALEITRMSVFQWAFFIFPNRTFWSSGAYLHHPLSCVWGSKLSIYKLSEVHWVHGLVTSLFFFKGMICDEIFSDLSSVAGWCKYAFRFPIYEDIRRFWVFKVQDPYCWWRSND